MNLNIPFMYLYVYVSIRLCWCETSEKKLHCSLLPTQKTYKFGLKFIDCNVLYGKESVSMTCFQTTMMNVSAIRPQIWPLCIYGIFVSFQILRHFNFCQTHFIDVYEVEMESKTHQMRKKKKKKELSKSPPPLSPLAAKTFQRMNNINNDEINAFISIAQLSNLMGKI